MKRVSVVAVFLIIFSSLWVPLATSDGGSFGFDTLNGFKLVFEKTQYAVIDYQDGYEWLYLRIVLDEHVPTQGLWVVPVPTNDTQIHIHNSVPVLSGRGIHDDLEESEYPLNAALAYTFPPAMPYLLMSSSFSAAGGAGGDEITVNQHVENRGMVCESLQAESCDALYAYFAEKGFEMSPEYRESFEAYIDKDYSFVLTWMNEGELAITRPGISIRFPSSRIFFPMMLTSIYDSKEIHIDLVIKGHVEVENPSGTGAFSDAKHYEQGRIEYYYSWKSTADDRAFIETFENDWNGEFTHVVIDAEARYYTQDLWFGDRTDQNVVQMFAEEHYFWVYLFTILACQFAVPVLLSVSFLRFKKGDLHNHAIIAATNVLGPFALFFGLLYAWSHSTERTWKFVAVWMLTFLLTFGMFWLIDSYYRWVILL